MRERVIGADAVRSFACLAVLLVHVGAFTGEVRWREPITALLTIASYGKFGVCIFFVLSGYLLGLPFWQSLDQRGKLPSLKIYSLRRAARIVPATWVCLIASFLVGQFLLTPVPKGHEVLRLFAGMTFMSDWSWITLFPTNVNGPLWSLSYEVWSYFFMAIGFLALKAALGSFWSPARGRAAWLFIIALALLGHAITTVLLAHDDSNTGFEFGGFGGARSWFPQYNAFGFFAMFAIGTFAAGLSSMRKLESARRAPALELALLILGYAIVAGLAAGLQANSFARPPFAFPTLPFIVAFLLLIAPHLPARALFENLVITFVADISFGIYIWHDLLLSVCSKILLLPIEAHERVVIVVLVAVLSTVLLAYVSFRFFERPIMISARKFEQSQLNRPRNHRLEGEKVEEIHGPAALPNTSTSYSVW